MLYDDCTENCERAPECLRCRRTKKPRGRDVAMAAANGYCDSDCPGYSEAPVSGHLWPGEIARSKSSDTMKHDPVRDDNNAINAPAPGKPDEAPLSERISIVRGDIKRAAMSRDEHGRLHSAPPAVLLELSSLHGLAAEVAGLEAQLATRDAEIATLTADHDAQVRQLGEARKRIAELEDKVADAEGLIGRAAGMFSEVSEDPDGLLAWMDDVERHQGAPAPTKAG